MTGGILAIVRAVLADTLSANWAYAVAFLEFMLRRTAKRVVKWERPTILRFLHGKQALPLETRIIRFG